MIMALMVVLLILLRCLRRLRRGGRGFGVVWGLGDVVSGRSVDGDSVTAFCVEVW